jgi:histidine triad (HIT) family protein
MTFNETCIFCKIAHGQAPASILYEDEAILAFLDIRPLTEGHTLVITKQHYVDIFDTPEEVLSQIYKVTKQVSTAAKKATNSDGITIIQQNGRAAGQDIFHIHVHVVPRFEGQKLPRFSSLKEVERAKLDGIAKKMKQHLRKN